MSRRDEHTHRCDRCQTKVECSGELSRNYDGIPETVCSSYHRLYGTTAEVFCADCAADIDNEELEEDSE
jgi:hypothetical protein